MDNSPTENAGYGPHEHDLRHGHAQSPSISVDKRLEMMSSLLEGSKIILESGDFSQSGQSLFKKCKNLTGASRGYVTLIDAESRDNRIVIEEVDGSWPLMNEDFQLLFADLQMKAISEKHSVFDNDSRQSNPPGGKAGSVPGIKNLLIAPLIHEHTVMGLMVLGDKRKDFNPVDVAIANAFAEMLALAWINHKRHEDLKTAVRKAQESDRRKSAFLSNMSHEIRTPLNGILGFSDLLAEPDLGPAERDRFIRIMSRNGEQLMSIINNILDISLIESGQIQLAIDWVNMKDLISEVYELFMSPGLRKKNVEYLLDCDPGAGRVLYTDRGRLRQILVNLFGNAAKFTQSGHVIMSCRVRSGNAGEEIVISVEDTGIGIPPERLEVIFERFRQADSSTKRRFGGTGLGLAISRGLTELLGGHIEVSSTPREGSSFSVIFPLNQ